MTQHDAGPDRRSTQSLTSKVQAFWNARAQHVGADADAVLHGTVSDETPVIRLRDRLEKAHLARVLPLRGDEHVLDLGGGAGRFAFWIAPYVRSVTLVDGSDALLALARAQAARAGSHHIETRHAVLPDFEPEPGRWDVVLVMGLAAHLEDEQLPALASVCARALKPHGRLVLKEPVTTDGHARTDARPERGYVAYFRPRQRYEAIFGSRFRLDYRRPTCAHPIPSFLGGTQPAARATGTARIGPWLDRLGPWWERLDPALQHIEQAIRATPALRQLLAPVPVLQDLYLFTKLDSDTEERSSSRSSRTDLPVEITVVVIAYNEQDCLEPVAMELVDALEGTGLGFEIVLVDDGSTDGTPDAMRRLRSRDTRMRIIALPENHGIGGALRAGFDAARGSWVSWIPADGQIAASTVVELVTRRHEAPMLTTVYAARDDAWYRHAISTTLNTVIRLRTGRPARSGGNYLFERRLWEQLAPRTDDTMVMSSAFRDNLRAAGVRIDEVPIRARARLAGRSKVLDPRTIGRTLRSALQLTARR